MKFAVWPESDGHDQERFERVKNKVGGGVVIVLLFLGLSSLAWVWQLGLTAAAVGLFWAICEREEGR